MDIEINSVKDLKKLGTIMKTNNFGKSNFNEIARNLMINIRMLMKPQSKY